MSINPIIREDAEWLMQTHADMFAEMAGHSLLLTGASGFLGSYMLDVFAVYNEKATEPIKILALDNFIAALPERIAHLKDDKHITIRKHDVTQPLNGERFDYIIHAASIASPIAYRQYPLETINANVNGTWRMLELAQSGNAKSILNFSSSEIYGDPDPKFVPTDENYWGNVSCTGPRACYDESKRIGETLCVNFFRQHGVPVKIVRPFNVYGPGQRLNDQRIIPDMMRDALKGGPLVLLSDGAPSRSFCYIRDFIAGSLKLFIFGQNGESYNVGNDEEVTIRKLAETVADIAGKLDVKFEKSGDKDYLKDNPNRRCPNLAKAQAAIGYRTVVGLREGLERTLRSYKVAS